MRRTRSVEEPGEKICVTSSSGKRAEALRELALDELGGPVGGEIADVEIHVMDLNVSQVMSNDLDHIPGAGRHLAQFVPRSGVQGDPCRLKLVKRTLEVGAKFGRRPASAQVGRRVGIVPSGMETSDLAYCWSTEEPGMGPRLVGEMGDHMPSRKSRQETRPTEVGIR